MNQRPDFKRTLIYSLLVIFLCNWIFGLIALWFNHEAESLWNMGEHIAAKAKHDIAMLMIKIALVLAVLSYACMCLYICFVVFLGGSLALLG